MGTWPAATATGSGSEELIVVEDGVASDVVVIGAGLAGAAAAWRLAQRGRDVTLVEQSVPANDAGSSHGSARIFRYAYPEQFYAQLVVDSLDGWDELSEARGGPLIDFCGAVDHGSARGPAHLAEVLGLVGVEHELCSPDEAERRWPGMRFESDALWQPGAGVLDAQTAVETMVDEAVSQGANVLRHRPVVRVKDHGAGMRIECADGTTLTAGHVVVAVGGWLPGLLGALPLPQSVTRRLPRLEVSQENAFHFPYRDGAPAGATSWPTFIHKQPSLQTYGLPGGRDADHAGQKVAEYNGGSPLRSAADQDRVIRPANRARVVDYVRQHLPGLEPEPYAETTCLFTNTPSEDFLIDRFDRLTIVSACSGHGAKFAPLLGDLAADLVEGRASPSVFRLDHHAR